MFKPAKMSLAYLGLGFALGLWGCATQGPSILQPTAPNVVLSAVEGDPSVRFYYEGNLETVSAIDAGIAFALAQGITESTAIVTYVREILGLPITPEDLTVASPLSISDFDGDGVSGTFQDTAVLFAISQGATSERAVERFCDDLLRFSCPVQDGTSLPGVNDHNTEWLLVGPITVTGGIHQFRVDPAFGVGQRTLTIAGVTLQGTRLDQDQGVYPIPFNSFEGQNQLEVAPGEALRVAFNIQLPAEATVAFTNNEGDEIRLLTPMAAAPEPILDFVSQFGSNQLDRSEAIQTDGAGNVYLAGYTEGDLGRVNLGGADAWLAKLDTNGSLVWLRQFGERDDDFSRSLAISKNGNILVAGTTEGTLSGQSQGQDDAFLASYTSEGDFAWGIQFGSDKKDTANFVTTDSADNSYLTGWTRGNLSEDPLFTPEGLDAWLAKVDQEGNLEWTRQLGSDSNDFSIVTESGEQGILYAAGYTLGNLGGANIGQEDAWLAQYTSDGDINWVRQFGSSERDFAFGVAVDQLGYIYIAGRTTGALGAVSFGGSDVWLAKYDASGHQIWVQQLGTSFEDRSEKVVLDPEGNIYLGGITTGSLGAQNVGAGDAWVARYSPEGSLQWVRQLGSDFNEMVEGIAIDPRSNDVYISGFTDGNLGSQNQGGFDAWFAKYSQRR